MVSFNPAGSTATTQAPTPEPQTYAGPQTSGGGTGQAPGNPFLASFAKLSTIRSTLSPAAEAYVETMVKYFHDNQFPVERLPVPEHQSAVFFKHRDMAYGLVFEELVTRPTANAVAGAVVAQSAMAMNRELNPDPHRPTTSIVNTIMVLPEDLSRAVNNAQNIINLFTAMTEPQILAMTVADLRDSELVFEPSLESARVMANQLAGTNQTPRMDWGGVLYLKKPNPDKQLLNATNMQQDLLTPLLCVGGFVDFHLANHPAGHQAAGGVGWQPVVRITVIDSLYKTPWVQDLAIGLAYEYMIKDFGWRNTVSSFAPGAPNLGSLTPDPDNPHKPFRIPDKQTLDAYINMHIVQPALLAIDVTEGRERLPYTWLYTQPEKHGDLIGETARFFNNNNIIQAVSGPIAQEVNFEFTGVEGHPQARRDSRHLSYINLVSGVGGTSEMMHSLKGLLHYDRDNPRRRLDLITPYAVDLNVLYITRTVLFQPAYLAALLNVIASSGLRMLRTTAATDYFSLAAFTQQAQQFASQAMPITQYQSRQNPFGGAAAFGATPYVGGFTFPQR